MGQVGPFGYIEFYFYVACFTLVAPFALRGVTMIWRTNAYATPPQWWFYSERLWRWQLRAMPTIVVGFIVTGILTFGVIGFEPTGAVPMAAYEVMLIVSGLYVVLVLSTWSIGRPRGFIPPYLR